MLDYQPAQTAQDFLTQLLQSLRNNDDDVEWCLDPSEATLAADAIEIAAKIAGGLPAELSPGQPQPCLGWQVACDECTYEPVRWTGLAFSQIGAHMLLQEHKAHNHQ